MGRIAPAPRLSPRLSAVAGTDVLDGGSGDNVVIQAIVAHGAASTEIGFASTAGAEAGAPLARAQANRLPLLAHPHA